MFLFICCFFFSLWKINGKIIVNRNYFMHFKTECHKDHMMNEFSLVRYLYKVWYENGKKNQKRP